MMCLPCAPLRNAHPFETGSLETLDKHFPVILLAIRQRSSDLILVTDDPNYRVSINTPNIFESIRIGPRWGLLGTTFLVVADIFFSGLQRRRSLTSRQKLNEWEEFVGHHFFSCSWLFQHFLFRFTKEKKLDIKTKIERMGGIYSNAFHDGVSHLVAEVRCHLAIWKWCDFKYCRDLHTKHFNTRNIWLPIMQVDHNS